MDGIRSRGLGVSVASFALSSFGFTLSIVMSLLDAFLGHDTVAHLLALMTGQHSQKHDPAPLHAQTHVYRAPSPARPHHNHHPNHHHHHHHRSGQTGILMNAANVMNVATQSVVNGNTTAVSTRLPAIRSHSSIPVITIHTPGHLGSQFTSTPSRPTKHVSGGLPVESRRNLMTPESDTAKHHQLHQTGFSPESLTSTSQQNYQVHPVYVSDSEIHDPSPGLRERTPSITFAHPITRPAKDRSQKSPASSNRLALPPLGTSPAKFRRKGLSRCSSSPNLSTPPATPIDFEERQDSASTNFLPSPNSSGNVHAESTKDVYKGETKVRCLPSKSNEKKPDIQKPKSLGSRLRKVSSTPGPLLSSPEKLEQTSNKKVFTFGFSAVASVPTPEKPKDVKPKRSQSTLFPPTSPKSKLRTQPYEAPYFFPTPDSVLLPGPQKKSLPKQDKS